MASPALRRLAMEAKKPRPCEGVRVLGPVSESEPLKYSIEITGPCVLSLPALLPRHKGAPCAGPRQAG